MKVGDTVLCIEDDNSDLVVGNTYKVTKVVVDSNFTFIRINYDYAGYFKRRFISLPDEIDLRSSQ